MGIADVRDRLFAARRRVDAATRGSPEWDAATAEIEDAEAAHLARLDRILHGESEVGADVSREARARSRRRR
jgi:hypothetical protein